MPSLGAGMEAGTVAEWRVAVGDRVARGDIIAEVETEKGLIEVEVYVTGVVAALLVEPGTKVPVGTRLAVIREAGEPEALPATAPAAPVRATPGARQLAREAGVDPEGITPTGKHGTLTRGDVAAAASRGARLRISPVARRRAEALGVDPATVPPGPDGAVHLRDVEAAVRARPKAEKPDPRAAMRRAIATAMTRSKREIPHYYLSHTIDLGPTLARLAELNAGRSASERLVPGVMLLSAAARALAKVPELNARWTGDEAPPLDRVHLGVAISLRGGGLVAPAIHDADTLSLDALMAALTDVVERARRGALRASELADPTVTVTSLGERGVDTVFGVIHPPQVAMIGFGATVERAWVVDGLVVPRPTVTVTLAADHRVSDGHRGGRYLAEVERLLTSGKDA